MQEDRGYSVEEYMQTKKRLLLMKNFVFNITQDKYDELKKLLDEIIEEHDGAKAHGTKLEDAVFFLLNNTEAFKVIKNVRSSTNEIDLLVELSDMGKIFATDGQIDLKGHKFIIECKNYNKKIDVTWVGKFCSLVNTSPVRLGILISNKGFKGLGKWDSSKGLAKKFYYFKECDDQKMYILDIQVDELKKLNPKFSFIDLIEAKIKELELDTKYTNLILPHESEGKFKK